MIREGDAVVRYLQEFQVWHWGLVYRIQNYTLDGIFVMEFTDSDKISIVPLRTFCWYRKYFWVHAFEEEMRLLGPSVFRNIRDRLRTAEDCYKKNLLSYRIDKYNCEYFVRMCVFNDPKLWESQQTKIIGRSTQLFFAKLATVTLAAIYTKFGQLLDMEKDYRDYDIRYEVAPDNSNIIAR